MDSPEAFRATSREGWEQVAEGWAAGADAMARDTMPVSRWLAEAIHPQPGHVVLEVAAGVGDVGLLIAELVQQGGHVLITDNAERMVAAARDRAEQLGVRNVDVREMEAEWLDLPTASVDAVVCRWAYMLVADPEAALREARRVLRPGGRIALAVWDAVARNPWMGVIRGEVERRGLIPPDAPGEPGPFALADPGRLVELLDVAGFVDVVVEPLDFSFTASSVDSWWESTLARSSRTAAAVRALAPAEHYALRDAVDAGYAPYVQPDGSVRLPARALMAAAGA